MVKIPLKLAKTRDLISIVIPCYNESENVVDLLRACESVLPKQYRYELLFVNDASPDKTLETLRTLKSKRKDIQCHVIDLARHAGKEIAVTAGLANASGIAVIIMDADLQHPPHVIPKLLAEWENGADVVIGVRNDDTKYAPWHKRQGSKLFYKIINAVSEVKIVPHATDFRLLDRTVLQEFNKFTERNRMNRGLIDWLGFNRSYVNFTPASRAHGVPGYSFAKLTGLALNSIVGMSLLPLKFAGYFGLAITLIFGSMGAIFGVEMFIFNDPIGLRISNIAYLAILIVFLIGLVLIALGLSGLYIATIHTEVTNRPLYVIRPNRLNR